MTLGTIKLNLLNNADFKNVIKVVDKLEQLKKEDKNVS